jgi:hypothetical protein
MVIDVRAAGAGLPGVAGAELPAPVGDGALDAGPVADAPDEPQAATRNTSASAAATPAALRQMTQAALMTTSLHRFRTNDAILPALSANARAISWSSAPNRRTCAPTLS